MIKILLLIGFVFFQITTFSQNYNAELILQNTTIVVGKNKLIKELHCEIKIYNRAGEKYTKVVIPYSKLNKVSNIEAYVKDSKGRIVKKLKKSDIKERSSISGFSLYEDDYVKEFILKYNVYPYTISYLYRVQQNEFLYIEHWMPVMAEDVPTRSASLKLSIPEGYKISYVNNKVKEPLIDTLENRINYQWETSYTDILKPEKYSPPFSDFMPSVAIVPINFKYDREGSLKDWKSFGNWQCRLLQGLNNLPDYEKNRIRLQVKGVDDEKEKIRILYHYLQDETRYVNVTIETGGLKPYSANFVARNKYGDCKALTNYFKSVLNSVGISAYYTKVYAGNPVKKINKDFPSQQSNHIILYIPGQDEDFWLDCTSKAAFNYLGTFTQNRNAFVVDEENSRFVSTPALKAVDVLDSRKIEINYGGEVASVKFKNTYRGGAYEDIRNIEENYNKHDKYRIIEKYIVNDGFQMNDYQIVTQGRDAPRIDLLYTATTSDLYKHYGNDILIRNIAFSLPDFEPPEKRKLPVQIDYPVSKADTLIYEIPAKYKTNGYTPGYAVKNKYGEYKFHIFEDTGKIMVIKSLLVHPGYYPLSEYKDFYSFYKYVFDFENKTHLSLLK